MEDYYNYKIVVIIVMNKIHFVIITKMEKIKVNQKIIIKKDKIIDFDFLLVVYNYKILTNNIENDIYQRQKLEVYHDKVKEVDFIVAEKIQEIIGINLVDGGFV